MSPDGYLARRELNAESVDAAQLLNAQPATTHKHSAPLSHGAPSSPDPTRANHSPLSLTWIFSAFQEGPPELGLESPCTDRPVRSRW